MILPRGYDSAGRQLVDIRVAADAPWRDQFWYQSATRPLLAAWASLQLVIRPAYDHATLTRELVSTGGGAEIIVVDAATANFRIEVAQSVVTTFRRLPDGTAGRYAQFLRFIYPDPLDTFEAWRGELIVDPGLLP